MWWLQSRGEEEAFWVKDNREIAIFIFYLYNQFHLIVSLSLIMRWLQSRGEYEAFWIKDNWEIAFFIPHFYLIVSLSLSWRQHWSCDNCRAEERRRHFGPKIIRRWPFYLNDQFHIYLFAVSGLPGYCTIFHFPFVLLLLLRHRRDILTFLDILTVYTMKTIYFLNASHLRW